MRALEAEVTSWALRERELRRELAAERAGAPDAPEPPESTSLGEGEMREAFNAARATRPPRRPRWVDDLFGDPPDPKE